MEFQSVYYTLVEAALTYPLIAGVLFGVAVIAVLWALFRGKRDWKKGKKLAMILALLVGVIIFFGLPALVHSGLSNMTYYVDWGFQAACVIGSMVYTYIFSLLLFAPKKDEFV